MLRRLLPPALVITLVACSGNGSSRTSHGAPASSTTVAAPVTAPIAWTSLHNPLLSDATHAVKDPALVQTNGRWYALFSRVDAGGQWRIGIATSADLRQWSAISTMPHDASVEGEASPDVVRAPGNAFVVTYQSFVHDRTGALAKLYYRTTADFVHFSDPRPLGHELHPAANDRMIDAAVAWTPAGLLLGYKYGADAQRFELARSTSGSLDGPWQLVGQPDIHVFGDTIENYQFVETQGRWQLLATSNIADRPFLFALAGDPQSPRGWLHWSSGQELRVPQESWSTGSGATGATYEHANCAYLIDRHTVDGYYYLVYSDSPNKTTFGGEGPAVVALARSNDLVHWSTPPS